MLIQPKLSIVLPTFNEIKNGFLKKNLELYSQFQNIEIICVDAGSSDSTHQMINQYSAKLIELKGNRVTLLERGMREASAEIVILHHPRSTLIHIKNVLNHKFDADWGAFTHKFDKSHPMLKFTSWWSNYARGDISKIFYLDHCFYLRKSLINKIESFPNVDLFEDTEISKVLNLHSSPKRVPYISETSSIRFDTNGILKQLTLNLVMKLMYFSKFSDKTMYKIYELGLNLNSKSPK